MSNIEVGEIWKPIKDYERTLRSKQLWKCKKFKME